jgi:FkbM family methyltransferase
MQLIVRGTLPVLSLSQRIPLRLQLSGPQTIEMEFLSAFPAATHQLTYCLGYPLITHVSEQDTVISSQLVQEGYWEFTESMVLLSLIRPGMTILDVGANLGYYSMLLARSLGSEGELQAFEPEPKNFFLLLANTLLLQQREPICPRIQLHRKALSDQLGTQTLQLDPSNFGFHQLITETNLQTQTVSVETTTIDHLRESGQLTRKIDLIKADIQGHELEMLQGAEKTISSDHPLLALELEPYISGEAKCQELLSWLDDQGYSHFRLFHSEAKHPPKSIIEMARLLSMKDIIKELKNKRIRAYGTILALPTKPVHD